MSKRTGLPRLMVKREKDTWPDDWPRHTHVDQPPPANTSPEAVALRKAAYAFGRLFGEPTDLNDIVGQKANWRLLAAAVSYARAVERDPEAVHERATRLCAPERCRSFSRGGTSPPRGYRCTLAEGHETQPGHELHRASGRWWR